MSATGGAQRPGPDGQPNPVTAAVLAAPNAPVSALVVVVVVNRDQ